ncbi:MAG TPA: helix-turn-helix transcriptional regulator [Solirubrobacteraceae bacterium]|nr:helix-turn-helix transcriptional regulator [Solirubrobacteraceae bacterium]
MGDIEINETVVLAAVERAVRHRKPDTPAGVSVWAVREQLGASARSREGRAVRNMLVALEGKGLQRVRRHGALTWELTAAGKRRLSRLRKQGELAVLGESPQHRAWREAHALAEQRLEAFRLALREGAQYTVRLMEEPSPSPGSPDSDVLLEVGERLKRVCWELASAIYCLYEWREPDDAQADHDDHADPGDGQIEDPRERKARRARRMGRRNIRLWDEQPLLAYIGAAIRDQRERRGLTDGELAEQAEVAVDVLARLEAGLLDPGVELLVRVAKALATDASGLVKRAVALEELAPAP